MFLVNRQCYNFNNTNIKPEKMYYLHCVKGVRIRSYSGPNVEKCGPE